ncbi:hypothetical protein BC834DRAFT_841920 [Gloeopeniophorella convolvens]|nr:hypothetical protein BC834DRAFT_841920 [Gloeopeniophorella convolvens]
MPRRIGRRPGAGEVLPAATLITQLASDVGDAMQIGPLKTAATLLRVILDTVQEVKSNRDACLRLARRAAAFVLNIRDTMDGKWDPAPPSLKEAVDRFESLLLTIRDWMRDLAHAKLFTRIFNKAKIRDKITDFELQLIDTVSQFQNSVLVELQHIMSQSLQATLSQETGLVRQVQDMHSQMIVGFHRGLRPQDEDGFPLVHRADIVLHGMAPMGGGWWQNLAEATVNGRPVLIKRYEGKAARKASRRKDDLAFLKSIWDARFPQLYGVSQQTNSNPPFIILHNVGITDLRAFITPYLQQGHLLEVAAIATRIAEHLRAGLTMLASSGKWPAIYDQREQPSLAMLSNLVVNNRGNIVIGGDIASDEQPQNHRGPLVWLCHEIFGERYGPGTLLGVDRTRRARQLANQIAGSILLSGTASPAQVSETLLVDLRDADWTASVLRELRASMASWGLDDRGGLFSHCTYGDVGFLVASPDPAAKKKTFVSVGNISAELGRLYAKILGEDEPFRRRRMTGHTFEGEFEEMLISEVTPDIVRFTFRNPRSISYEHQFSVHEKPKDDPSLKSARWQSIVTNIARFAKQTKVSPDTMILITGHRTTAVIAAKYQCPDAAPPPEVHLFLSYEDWTTSYWSYDDEYLPAGERSAISEPTAALGASSVSERRGFYIQFIPEDFEDVPDESAPGPSSLRPVS